MPFRDLTIPTKLRLLITSACALVVAMTCCAFVAYEWYSFRVALLESITVRAQILAANATAALAFNSPQDARDLLRALASDPHALGAALYDVQGAPFAEYARNPGTRTPTPPGVGRHAFEPGVLAVRVAVNLNGRSLGSLALWEDLRTLARRMQFYAGIALGFMILSSVIAYALAGLFQRALSRPILDLAATAHDVAERQDYGTRAVKLGNDEIGFLTDAFNMMLGRIEHHERHLESEVAARTEELQAANSELEAFSFSVAHDLRAPLRSIAGMVEVLLDDFGPTLPEGAKAPLFSVQRNATRMSQLISDMLEFARQSRQKPVLAPVDMEATARSILADFAEEIAGRGAVVEIGALPPCRADASMLRQVLVNLVSNALKYSRGRTPARIEIGALPAAEAGRVGYFVKDNGVGFRMEYATRLFQPFQRLHSSNQFEGTGVGLAIAQRVVQRHGGRMWAEAEPNVGAAFYFTLPAA